MCRGRGLWRRWSHRCLGARSISRIRNSFKGKQQYCFEHLKRDCKELLEKEPQNAEYQKFVPAFVSLLREAMQLGGRGLEDGDYYDEAKRIKNEMLKMINAQAKDPGLQKYQDIFRRHPREDLSMGGES